MCLFTGHRHRTYVFNVPVIKSKYHLFEPCFGGLGLHPLGCLNVISVLDVNDAMIEFYMILIDLISDDIMIHDIS